MNLFACSSGVDQTRPAAAYQLQIKFPENMNRDIPQPQYVFWI